MFISFDMALTSFEWYYAILFSGILIVINIQNDFSSLLILINNCHKFEERRSLSHVRWALFVFLCRHISMAWHLLLHITCTCLRNLLFLCMYLYLIWKVHVIIFYNFTFIIVSVAVLFFFILVIVPILSC